MAEVNVIAELARTKKLEGHYLVEVAEVVAALDLAAALNAGVDTAKLRAGYSAMCPGRPSKRTPDVSRCTHFLGSDGGEGSSVRGIAAARFPRCNSIEIQSALRAAGAIRRRSFGVPDNCPKPDPLALSKVDEAFCRRTSKAELHLRMRARAGP